MSDPPCKTVAFLFTDLEGSTRLWRSYPERMPAAYVRHDAILRDAVAAHGGTIYKTVGDAIQAVFPSIGQAVAAAADAQRELVKSLWPTPEPIRVRIVLHAGDVAPDVSGDYRSPVLNRLGRLLDATHGGQVLLSESVVKLVKPGDLPPGVALRDLGRHRLKDLGRPEPLYQLVAPGLPVAFPRPRTVPSPWTGIGAAVALALAVLLFFPLVTGASDLEPAAFAPRTIGENLTGMVLGLAAVRDHILLALTGGVIAVSAAVVLVWWRGARISPGAWGGLLRMAGLVVGPRTVGFFLGLTVLLGGAYGYQQYLWRVALPIPGAKLGVALTREAAAASFDEELALVMREGSGDVVVRELPVGFDAADVDEARRLGRRIGADVVLIYREDAASPGGRYVAYVVFTDPDLDWIVSTTSSSQGESIPSVDSTRELEVPTLRTATIDGVFAVLVYTAAGIVAYHDGNYAQAISHLERARMADPEGANAGLIDFYLAGAHDRVNSDATAAATYERGLERYAGLRAAGEPLSSQDLLLIAWMARSRGIIAEGDGEFDAAISWYERGTELYRHMSDLKGGTVRPEDVRLAFAQIFAYLADAYRLKHDADLERYWAGRAEEELLAAAADAADPGSPRFAVDEADVRLMLGDCIGAQAAVQRALLRDPRSFDAHFRAFEVYRFQSQQHLAAGQLERLIAARPDDVRGQVVLAQYLNGEYGISDWTWLAAEIDEAEALLRAVVEREPTDPQVRWTLARTLYIQAIVRNRERGPADELGDILGFELEYYDRPPAPEQLRALIDALAVAIDQGSVAAELGPDETWPRYGLLRSYQERRRALANLLGFEPLILADWRGVWQDPRSRASETKLAPPSVAKPGTPTVTRDLSPDVERLLADDAAALAEIEWFLVPGSRAPLVHQVEAWHQKLSILGTEWRLWNHTGDETRRAAALEPYRRAVAEALVFADAIPVDDGGLPNLPLLFSAIEVAATDLGLQTEADAARSGFGESRAVLERANTDALYNDGAYIRHWATLCNEMEEHWIGRDRAYAGDLPGAAAAYKAALDLNPDNVWAQYDYANASYQMGDLATAIEWGTKAARSDPRAPINGIAWLRLGVYHAASGDRAASDAAFDHYFAMRATIPIWTWGSELFYWGFNPLGDIVYYRSHDVEAARAALVRLAAELRLIEEHAEGADAAWCSYLLSQIQMSIDHVG